MDLKALIAKMDQIESKKFLTEGKDWDKDGKVEKPAQEYKGVKDAAIKKAMGKKDKKVDENMIDFKGAIAQALLKEFGLDERVTLPPNPWTNDPEKSAAWEKLSLKDKQWLGGADPTDPYILSRMNRSLPDEPAAEIPKLKEAVNTINTELQDILRLAGRL